MSEVTDKQILKAAKKSSTRKEVAEAVDLPVSTLRDRLERTPGLKKQVIDALQPRSPGAAHNKTPMPEDDALLEAANVLKTRKAIAEHFGVTPSTLRRHLDAKPDLRAGFDAALSRSAPAPKPLPGDEVTREEKLEHRVKELESRARKERKEEVLQERILDMLEGGIEVAEKTYSPLPIPKSKLSTHKHEFVLLWSDPHAGEVVSKEETNGINEYNWEVMMRRHDRLRESIFSYQDNRPYPIEKINIFALGDMLSGDIHEELSETNEVPLHEATIKFGLDGSEWIASLHERFPEIFVAGVPGNHPRAKKKPQAKQAFNNADWAAYHVMEIALRKYEKIQFEIPKSGLWPVTIAENWRALLFHGDGIRSTMPGVPWGGVMRRVNALQNQYTQNGMPIDLFCLGHFHTANLVESNAGRVAMNGSIKGTDEYSVKQFGGGRSPQQMLLTFHPRRGLTDCSLIDLEPALR